MEIGFPKLPIADGVDTFVNWLTVNLEFVFDGITTTLESVVEGMVTGFSFIPP